MYGHGQLARLFQWLHSGLASEQPQTCLVITRSQCLGGVQHLAIISSATASCWWLLHPSAAALLGHCFLGGEGDSVSLPK